MRSFAAARGLFVGLLVRTVWGVRSRVLERPATHAVLRTVGRPAIWLMHRLAGRAPPPPAGGPCEPVLHLPLDYPLVRLDAPPSIAVLLHAYYDELLPELSARLAHIPYPADLFVTVDTEAKQARARAALAGWTAGRVEVRITPNRGRNIAPQFVGLADVFPRYDLVLLLHTKASVHTSELSGWRAATLDSLLGSPLAVQGIVEAFARLPALGVVAPRTYPFVRPHMVWGENFAACRALGDRMGLALSPASPLDFPAGAMFWARSAALKPLLDLGLIYDDFPEEAGQKDDTLAHAVERLVFHACELSGRRWIRAGSAERIAAPERLFHATEPLALRRVLTDQGRTVVLPGRPPRPTLTAAEIAAAPGEAAAKAVFRAQCRAELDAFLATGARLSLPTSTAPEVSIVLVLFNQAELTFQCLRSLVHALDRPTEVIVVDNASTDDTAALLDRLDGARIVRQGENLHFVRGVNAGAALATGQALLLLNNDARVQPGSIGAAWARLAEPDVGAVGGRIVLLDGTLQEAGSIIRSDGTAEGYGRGRDPWDPEFQFRRDIDYASGAFLMLRRDLFERLGGLDEAFAPAYYEETDLCMRIRAAGFRVAYEPRVEVHHFEFGSAASSDAALDLQRAHREVFEARHRAALQANHPAPGAAALEARMRPPPARRVLIVEDQVPYPQLGAGYPRARDLVLAVHATGAFVTLYPAFHPDADWTSAYDVVPPDVEIAAERGAAGLADFLRERSGYYDAVIVSRPHNMQAFAAALKAVPGFIAPDRLVYDAEAIFAARDASASPRAIAAETALARGAAGVLAVNEAEAQSFRAAGQPNVHVLGHAQRPRPTRAGFAARRDILFVGALDGDTTPNVDSLVFFVEEVMPKLDALIGRDWTLQVAGRAGSARVRALASPRVKLLGAVPDLAPLYGKARVFIAPTRFAAGSPMKVHEAAAHGLPVVATSLLATQLGWTDELLVADTPDDFAQACARLYQDADLWKSIRAKALAAVTRDCSPDAFNATVRDVLDAVARPPGAR